MSGHARIDRRLAAAALGISSAFAATATAQDVAIEDVLVTQAIRFFATPLVGENVTFVRVFVETPGTSAPVPGVDGLVRVFVDGVEADFSPLRSINGPITSPSSPSDLVPEHHLNFVFVAPTSSDVDLRVVLNPSLSIPGDDPANNVATVNNLNFQCRGTVDLTYVPINYTPGGGLPSETFTQPGVGDGFLRGIFKPGAWDYHRSPLGPLTWTQNINQSNNALLNTLRDIRTSQIPSAGYPTPDFVYGWLPGNPFSGNGQAIGIPGDVGFGNTENSRFQRTFAHEIGHLLGEGHNNEEANTLCIDVEHHLRDPLNIAQIRFDELDVMVAGQITSVAWVSSNTYNNAIGDPRFACDGIAPPDGGSGSGEEADDRVPALRISGEVDHVAGTVRLDPAMTFPGARIDPDTADGTVTVVLLDDRGRVLHQVRAAAGHTRACCADPNHIRPTSPLHVLVPAAPRGRTVARIEVRDAETGAILSAIDRSASAPLVRAFGPEAVDAAGEPQPFRPGMRIDRPTRIAWSVDDADGDAVTAALFYSPDGQAWLPFRADIVDGGFDLDPDQMPRSTAGRLRLIVTDGLNASIVESPSMSFLGGTQPEVYVITPNQFDSIEQGGPVVLHGYAWDREDGTIAGDIQWVSSLDGPIGTGRLFTVDDLSPGLHLITAFVTDSDGNTTQSTKGISIAARALSSPDIDGDGAVSFGDLLAMLAAFGPCGDFCPGDLNGDDAVDFGDVLSLLAAWTG